MTQIISRSQRKQINNQLRKERMAAARVKGTHSPLEWEQLKAEFNYRCVRCGADDFGVQKDHIVPVYQGGSDSIVNLQPLCASCNSSKGPETFSWVQFRREGGF